MQAAAQSLSDGIQERIDRWRDFLNNPNPRRHLYIVGFPGGPERPKLWPQLRRERIEFALRQYEWHLQRARWVDDDFVPHLDLFTGTEIFAEAMGCPVHRPENDMPFALPLVHSAAEADKIKVPELSRSTLAYLFEMADEVQRRAGKGPLFRLPDIQSPMDIAALIWDKSDLYIALTETPRAVVELAARVRRLLVAFLDEWLARYGRQFIAHFPTYYMDRGLTLSEDEVGAVGTEAFEEFFLPELAELSHRYGGIGVHCCANARHQWPAFKKIPGLKLLNIVHNAQMCRGAQEFFATHCVQMHNWAGDGPPRTWPARFPKGSRIVIELAAETREQAAELAATMKEACAGS
jgi:hypothetical protein